MYDLIIIGAGPAGLSAAVYGRRAGFELLVVEQTPMGGGQVVDTYEVDNYLGMPGTPADAVRRGGVCDAHPVGHFSPRAFG